MELVTAAEMRALDRAAIEERKIPSLRLMENAGRAVVLEMQRQFGPLRGKTVTVVSGKGQNGGDGRRAAASGNGFSGGRCAGSERRGHDVFGTEGTARVEARSEEGAGRSAGNR